MKVFKKIRSKFSILLISLILILCVGFVFVACGTGIGPQQKVLLALAGVFGIDFNANNQAASLFSASSTMFSQAGTELTIEAWVKRKVDAPINLSGGILSRYGSGGLSLYIRDNEPKFILQPTVATTTFMVSSGASIADEAWMHVAGVLVDANHSADHAACTTPGGESETPHIDIYTDGVFRDCASTGSQFTINDTPDAEGNFQLFIGQISQSETIDTLTQTQKFGGIIDEVRFWTVARTQAEIQACMNTLLNVIGGTCGIDPNKLKGYWPLNEGQGTVINDISGHGNTLSIQNPFGMEIGWTGDWVAGKL